MFVGVLCDQFVEAKENISPERNYFVSSEQKKWINYQNLIIKSNSNKVVAEKPTNKYRLFLYLIAKHKIFDFFMLFCIIANIVVLGCYYEGSSTYYNNILEDINYFFTGVFTAEFLLKILGFGPKVYFASNWNRFDFLIVFCSMAEIISVSSENHFEMIFRKFCARDKHVDMLFP